MMTPSPESPETPARYLHFDSTQAETLEEIAVLLPKRLYNIACFTCSEEFCEHWLEAAQELILSSLRNERERCAKLADEYARRLRTVGSHLVAAGVEVVASEIRSGKDGN